MICEDEQPLSCDAVSYYFFRWVGVRSCLFVDRRGRSKSRAEPASPSKSQLTARPTLTWLLAIHLDCLLDWEQVWHIYRIDTHTQKEIHAHVVKQEKMKIRNGLGIGPEVKRAQHAGEAGPGDRRQKSMLFSHAFHINTCTLDHGPS